MSTVKDANKIDRKLVQEEKQDEMHVKAIEKDLKKVEKKESSLSKGASKAEKEVAKHTKQEHRTAEKLNDAIHAHENAAIALQRSKEEVQNKHAARDKAAQTVEQEKSLLGEALRTKSIHVHEHAIKRAELSNASGIGGHQEPSFTHDGGGKQQQSQSHGVSPFDDQGQDVGQSHQTGKVPGAYQDPYNTGGSQRPQ